MTDEGVGSAVMSITDPLDDELASLGPTFAVHIVAPRQIAHDVLDRIRADRHRWPGTGGRDSPVVTLPDGALLRLDGVATRADTRSAIAGAIRRVLDDAGLDPDAVILHTVDGLDDLDSCPRAVVLRLFPPPSHRGRSLPPTWIDVAAEWVFGDLSPDDMVRVRVLGVELRIRVADAAGVLHGCAASGAWCDVVTGDVAERVRTASISFGSAPHVAVAGGGPRCDDAGLLARFDLLADVATDLADWCAYACIDFEEGFDQLALGLATSAWTAAGHAPANRVAGERGDQAVPDVYPFQMLGPGHRHRLDAAGVAVDWTQVIDDHRTLLVGEPADWLADSPHRDEIRAEGWSLLSPLLLTDGDLGARSLDRSPAPDELVTSGGLPGLAHIVIEPEPHARRGTRLTPLELAAWLAGEPHGEHPTAISPVLRAVLRSLAFGLDAERRQDLKDVVAIAVRSNGDLGDDDRVARLVDWLVRDHAAAWLRRAGLDGLAGRLTEVTDTAGGDGAQRAVLLLDRALITAHRRLEIASIRAGDNAATVASVAWSAWERAAESSGWTAVSGAVSHGIPPELASEVDRRLVDASRDRAAEGGRDDGATEIWLAAFDELGRMAWRRAWERAEQRVHREAAFSLRAAVRSGLDDLVDGHDGLDGDLALDAVDRAASAVLGLGAKAPDGGDPFEAARHAECGPPGAAWRHAVEQARDAIGGDLFDDAIAEARDEIDRWLSIGPGMITRLTTTALAGEAAGVAARAVASQAATDCVTRGGTIEDAEAAVDAALGPVVDDLATRAMSLVGQLAGDDPSTRSADRSAAIA